MGILLSETIESGYRFMIKELWPRDSRASDDQLALIVVTNALRGKVIEGALPMARAAHWLSRHLMEGRRKTGSLPVSLVYGNFGQLTGYRPAMQHGTAVRGAPAVVGQDLPSVGRIEGYTAGDSWCDFGSIIGP